MNETVFKVLIVCGQILWVILMALIGFIVRNFLSKYKEEREAIIDRLNSHSNKIDNQIENSFELHNKYTELAGELKANALRDESRMELLKEYMKNTKDGIEEIKRRQERENQDIHNIDKRLTDYIISTK